MMLCHALVMDVNGQHMTFVRVNDTNLRWNDQFTLKLAQYT